MAMWKKSLFKGLRYREHDTKTRGVGKRKRPLRYYVATYKWLGKTISEGLGWEPELAINDKEAESRRQTAPLFFRTEEEAYAICQWLSSNRKSKTPPFTVGEVRQANEDKLESRRQAAEIEQQKIESAKRFTFGAMLSLYADHLDRQGKVRSAKSARSAFKVHIPDQLAELPAGKITRAQITESIRRVREAGKNRTAGILRAYLHAAYEVAMSAETDSGAPANFIPFQIDSNPVRGIKAIPVAAGQRVLSIEELMCYLAALDDRPSDIALKVALLAGGQRMEQLLKSTPADWDQKTKVLTLFDGKGKRITPRLHSLPLGEKAAELVGKQAERARAAGRPFIFFSERSERIDVATPGKRAKEIAAVMGGEMFDLRDIRRTCETHLAKIGISLDTRAQLLSHGISGVQAKHYDRYTYEREKRAALSRWEEYLHTGSTQAKVIPLRRAAR